MVDFSDVFTTSQIAREILHDKVTRHSVRRWCVKGIGSPRITLKFHRLGGQIVIRRADLEDFLTAVDNPELYRRESKNARVTKAKARLAKAGV